jgi:hypothetical protein
VVFLSRVPEHEAGLHAPFGGAPAGVLRLAVSQMIDVAGELAVQEGFGLVAGGLDQSQVGERDDDRLAASGLQFAGGVAEAADFGMCRRQKRLPSIRENCASWGS